VLGTVHARSDAAADEALATLATAIQVGNSAAQLALVSHRVSRAGTEEMAA
jgi:hypothetical protein